MGVSSLYSILFCLAFGPKSQAGSTADSPFVGAAKGAIGVLGADLLALKIVVIKSTHQF